MNEILEYVQLLWEEYVCQKLTIQLINCRSQKFHPLSTLSSVQMLKREWGEKSNGKLPHLFIPSKTTILFPEFAVKTCPWAEHSDDDDIQANNMSNINIMDDITLTIRATPKLILHRGSNSVPLDKRQLCYFPAIAVIQS